MSEQNDGGPAFPRDSYSTPFKGMSLRDWFIGQSLLLAALNVGPPGGRSEPGAIAEEAARIADACLSERTKQENRET